MLLVIGTYQSDISDVIYRAKYALRWYFKWLLKIIVTKKVEILILKDSCGILDELHNEVITYSITQSLYFCKDICS